MSDFELTIEQEDQMIAECLAEQKKHLESKLAEARRKFEFGKLTMEDFDQAIEDAMWLGSCQSN